MKKTKTKFIESAFLGYGLTFMIVLTYSLLILVTFVSKNTIFDAGFVVSFVCIFMLGILPTLTWIFMIHRGFSIIEINETGIHKSLFIIFRKKSILWDEVKELRIIHMVDTWLFIGKIEMGQMCYDKLVNHKDVLHLTYSEIVYTALRQYCDKEILGLNNNLGNP